MNVFDDMRQAVVEAERTLDAADRVATAMARTLVGRLRKVNSNASLAALKKELARYNAHTGRWQD